MKILLAPDKFKGSLSAVEVCRAMEEGIKEVDPQMEVIHHPLADGGENSIDLVSAVLRLNKYSDMYPDPLQRAVWRYFYADGKRAYIEMAQTAGLANLKKEEYNCLETDSLGVGYQIKDAVKLGVKEIYLFIGGSATNDGGAGMATALGYRFLDINGRDIPPSGKHLVHLHTIVPPPFSLLRGIKVKVISDVSNALLGPEGATYVYAPQKGAGKKELPLLEAGLAQLSAVIERDLGKQVSQVAGAGAAGGMGAGALAFLNAEILPGIDTVMKLTSFEQTLAEADVVLTGEGKLDSQSLKGKVVHGVAKRARATKKPLAIFCGSLALEQDELQSLGAIHVSALLKDGVSLEEAISHGHEWLKKDVASWLKTWTKGP